MEKENITIFEREIAALCRRLGLGLTGATVFVMEPADFALVYVVDDDSRLTFGPTSGEFVKSDQNSALGASQERSQHQYSSAHR